jgi:hypothetical protein
MTFKTGDKLLCIEIGAFFDHGIVYTCEKVKTRSIKIEGFEDFGWFSSDRFIFATELNEALS